MRIATGPAALMLGALTLGAPGARADIRFDFEHLPGNTDNRAGDHTLLSLESGGLHAVLYRTSGERFTVWNSAGQHVPGTWGTKHLSPFFDFLSDDYMAMSLSAPASRVTMEFGDYGEDHDVVEVHAFEGINLTGRRLGWVSAEMGGADMRWDGPTTVTFIAEPGQRFRSIKFRGGEDPFLHSTFVDNIVVGVAPTPGTLGALGVACALAAARLRRRDAA